MSEVERHKINFVFGFRIPTPPPPSCHPFQWGIVLNISSSRILPSMFYVLFLSLFIFHFSRTERGLSLLGTELRLEKETRVFRDFVEKFFSKSIRGKTYEEPNYSLPEPYE